MSSMVAFGHVSSIGGLKERMQGSALRSLYVIVRLRLRVRVRVRVWQQQPTASELRLHALHAH
jgi:hypothetical protein